MSSLSDFLFGTSASQKNVETLTPQQQNLFQQLQAALMGGQAQGPFGGAIQNLAGLASGDPEALQAFEQPLMRQFQEETIPGLASRFAGMGSGGALGGSGFRNAALREGSNLQERIGAQRAGLQMQATGQLGNLFGQATQPQFMPGEMPATEGFLPFLVGNFARGAGQAFTGGF
jgi:hypothetical protein